MRLATRYRTMHSKGTIGYDDKDRTILMCIMNGEKNKEIAPKVFLGKRTVDGRVYQMMIVMGAKNRTDLVMKAIRKGII